MAKVICESTSTKYSTFQLNQVENALTALRRAGIPELSPAYQQIYQMRGVILRSFGIKVPRAIHLIAKLLGLSPGEVRLFFDPENGWLTDWRDRPGSRPVYHFISTDQAIAIIKGEMTHEFEAYLSTPDDYVGE